MNELIELIKSIRNRCDVILLLLNEANTEHLVHTILEDLHQDSQEAIDKYCVENPSD